MLNEPRFQALRVLVLTLAVTLTLSATAQPGMRFTTSDKKAIKLYQEAISTYELGLLDESTLLIEKAIERDQNFAEAYMLRAQIANDHGDVDAAIDDLRMVTIIAPEEFPQMFLFLGELLMREERYTDARNQLISFRSRELMIPQLNDQAELMILSCNFAEKAKAHPVAFDPINLGPNINTDAPEYFPCITADSEIFLFTRVIQDHRVRGGRQEDFFVSHRTGGGWSQSSPLAEVNTPFNEGAPTISADGQLLIYTACESYGGDWGPYDGLGSCDLFVARRVGDHWGKGENLRTVNSYDWDSQPSFSADGKTLYFVRGKYDGTGIAQQDIYYAELQPNGEWSKAKRIPGEINTPFEEESVMIHPDGETLYFSSNGHPGMGGLDIFVSKKQEDGTWGKPQNLGYPINTGKDENSLLVDAGGELAYFASDRAGGFGDLDLYRFILPERARPNKVTYVTGEVFDSKSLRRLEARVELIDLETGSTVVEAYSDPQTGSFLVVLPPGKDYALNVARPDYLFYSDHFSLKETKVGEPFSLEIPLEKMKEGSRIVLNNVFFDTDSYVLKLESMVELDKLVMMMQESTKLAIEIGGHTDNIGSDGDNQELSERRAQAVVDYLVSQGIRADRLAARGYGETIPVASNESAAGRALNRRTEMKVLAH